MDNNSSLNAESFLETYQFTIWYEKSVQKVIWNRYANNVILSQSERHPPMMPSHPLATWSREVMWQITDKISPLLQGPWSPSVAAGNWGWRGSIHKITWPLNQVVTWQIKNSKLKIALLSVKIGTINFRRHYFFCIFHSKFRNIFLSITICGYIAMKSRVFFKKSLLFLLFIYFQQQKYKSTFKTLNKISSHT